MAIIAIDGSAALQFALRRNRGFHATAGASPREELGINREDFFLAFIFVQRWSLAVYYRALGNGICKSFSLSAKAAKGMHTNIISFKFSFIGWGILSLLILPLIWTVPYYGISNAIFAKYLMERYEHSLAQVPETSESQITFTETD